MITNTPTASAPDESAKAYQRITEAIAHAQGPIDYATARLIAAALHPGPGTALEQFAATGRFDLVVLEHELRMHRYPMVQEVWRGALLTYLESKRRQQPWMRGISPRHRRRLEEERAARRASLDGPFSEGESEAMRNGQQSG